MVSNTGTTADTRRIRRLKSPQAIAIEASEDGLPLRLKLNGVWRDVRPVRRPWRIDQLWWRGDPVQRDYFQVIWEDSAPITIYRDAVSGEWLRQEYG